MLGSCCGALLAGQQRLRHFPFFFAFLVTVPAQIIEMLRAKPLPPVVIGDSFFRRLIQ